MHQSATTNAVRTTRILIGTSVLAAAAVAAACSSNDSAGTAPPLASGGTFVGQGGAAQGQGGAAQGQGGAAQGQGGAAQGQGGAGQGQGGAAQGQGGAAQGQGGSIQGQGGATQGQGGSVTSNGGASTDAGGATASGGAVGAGGTTDPCAPKTCSSTTDCTASAATAALLTDFSNNAGEWHGTDTEWWTKLFGGTYVYPALDACATTQPTYPLTQDFAGGSWHITGTVGTYSGIGMWLSPCMADFSAYKGISFTIGGNVGTKGTVVFAVATAATTEKTATTCSPNTATCVKPTATGTTPAPDACVAASKSITVASAGTPVTVLWTDLTGGLTSGGTAAGALNPATITGLSWTLDWNWQYTTTNNYQVDLTIDNIQLVQ